MKIPKDLQRRFCALRAQDLSAEGSGGFSGVANVMGRIDAYRSCIFPGAFKGVTKSYVDSGSILYGHVWNAPEIGMPTAADERGRDVVISAEFHDDEHAQRVRGIMTKRLGAGKRCDLSVGFWPDWESVAEFKNGADMLAFAKGKGYDLSLFDSNISTYDGWCWAILRVADWAETSVVTRGATPGSQVMDARGMLNDLSSGALAAQLPDHLDTVLAAVQGVTSRIRTVRSRRVEDGRDLSHDRAQQVDDLIRELGELRGELTTITRHPSADLDALNRRLDDLLVDQRLAALA